MKKTTLFMAALLAGTMFSNQAWAGTGTQDDPYTVAEAQQHQGEGNDAITAWVKGFIVGGVPDDDNKTQEITSNDNVVWGAEGVRATAVLIADSKDVKEYTQCVIVNLKNGSDARKIINLADNPDNLGKEVKVCGTLKNYFKIPGVRDVESQFELEGYEAPDYVFYEPFSSGKGDFNIQDTNLPDDLTHVWTFDDRYGMKASAFKDAAYAAESWLISPTVDLTGVSNATLTFDHAVRNIPGNTGALTLHFSTDYTDDVTTANWTEVDILTWSEEQWAFVAAIVNVPADMQGSANLHFAFKYTSTTSDCNTWEINTVIVDGEKSSGIAGVATDETAFYVSNGVLMLDGVANGTQVEIYNALGARMMTTVFDGAGIPVSDLNSGMYIVRAGKDAKKVMF